MLREQAASGEDVGNQSLDAVPDARGCRATVMNWGGELYGWCGFAVDFGNAFFSGRYFVCGGLRGTGVWAERGFVAERCARWTV
jgi:hypothetical protein